MIAEVVTARNSLARLVVLQQEREQVGQFRIVEIGIAAERDGVTAALQRPSVYVVVEFERHLALLGVALQRALPAPQSGHQRLQEGSPIRRVSPGQNRYAVGERHRCLVDPTDVPDIDANDRFGDMIHRYDQKRY